MKWQFDLRDSPASYLLRQRKLEYLITIRSLTQQPSPQMKWYVLSRPSSTLSWLCFNFKHFFCPWGCTMTRMLSSWSRMCRKFALKNLMYEYDDRKLRIVRIVYLLIKVRSSLESFQYVIILHFNYFNFGQHWANGRRASNLHRHGAFTLFEPNKPPVHSTDSEN